MTPTSVDLLGPVPPPFGGVSIHLVRLQALLAGEGHDARIRPYTGLTAKGRLGKGLQAGRQLLAIHANLLARPADVMHVHYGGLGYFLALAPLMSRSRARRAVSFHSVRILQDLEQADAGRRRRALGLLAGFDLFVVVRGEIGDALRDLGLTGPALTVMPAFLPPAVAEADPSRLPAEDALILAEASKEGRRHICCGAYYLGEGYGHQDIYGVQELVTACDRLDGEPGVPFDLWVLVSNAPDTAARRDIETDLRRVADRWRRFRLHLRFGRPMIPVLARASGFVRPSREDGDSVAVREALAFGLPVLASDVVDRPEGVAVYSPGTPDALAEALRGFLDEAPAGPGTGAAPGPADDARYRGFVADLVGG